LIRNSAYRANTQPLWCASVARRMPRLHVGGMNKLSLYRNIARMAVGLLALGAGATAHAQQVALDPAGSGPIVGAVRWLQGTLMGTAASVAAVIAVAVVGFMMLSGRMNWRYGACVIVGCFILFGAGSIVGGIQSAAGGY